MKKVIRLISVFICAALIVNVFILPVLAFTAGFAGVSDYSSNGSCYGDRAGAQYVNNLYSQLTQSIYYSSANHFALLNSAANKSVFSSNWSEKVNLFAYAGHGHNINSLNNAAHFYATSTQSSHNGGCTTNIATNATTSEIILRNNLRYMTMYTCNFLNYYNDNAKLNNMRSMFQGGRAICGFASTMYLDSREGIDFGNILTTFKADGNPQTIKDAFFEAAALNQPRNGSMRVIARWMGFNEAKDDTLVYLNGPVSVGRWGNQSPSSYIFEDRVIN